MCHSESSSPRALVQCVFCILLVVMIANGWSVERQKRSSDGSYGYYPERDELDGREGFLNEYENALEPSLWNQRPLETDEGDSAPIFPTPMRKRSWYGGGPMLTTDETDKEAEDIVEKRNPVSEEELHEMFSDDQDKKKKSENKMKKSNVKRTPSKQDVFDNFLQSALASKPVSVKKKRSTDELEEEAALQRALSEAPARTLDLTDDANAEESVEEMVAGSKATELVERLLLLKTENTFLKDALNAATRAQLSGNSPEDLSDELTSLTLADEISGLLNKLDGKDNAEAIDEAEEEAEAIEEANDEAIAEERANEILRMASEDEEKRNMEKRKSEEDERENAIEMERDAADFERLINLNRQWEKSEEEEQRCPQIESLQNGCQEVASIFQLTLDAEAALACDSHKICYACVGEEGFDECDSLYQSQTAGMCSEEADPLVCVEQAKSLLDMMQHVHTTQSMSHLVSDSCQRQCVSTIARR